MGECYYNVYIICSFVVFFIFFISFYCLGEGEK